MTYGDAYKAAKAAKSTRELSPVFVKWEEEGQAVVGKLLNRSLVKSRQSGSEYADYVVDTDDGVVHFACGNQFDEKVGNNLVPGKVYAWTFHGKRDIGKGRRVNDFSLEEVPTDQRDPLFPEGEANPL